MISCGDWINHAIFNYEELRGGLSRLLRKGLIRQSRKGWAATPAACKAATVRGRGFQKQFEALRALLQSTQPRTKAPRLSGLTSKSFEAAVQGYLQSFDR